MTQFVYLNGRFLRQAVTGVQRFHYEMKIAVDNLIAAAEWRETVILVPPQQQRIHLSWGHLLSVASQGGGYHP